MRLSDAGLGDYWDDVDALVRNRLIEQQYVDLPAMRQIAGLKPDDTSRDCAADEIPGRLYRQLAHHHRQADVREQYRLGHFWAVSRLARHHAVRQASGVATVNLFLNRASEWMNVASWLPYQGKVELTNKRATRADVRIPGWVDIKQVKCFKNNAPIRPWARTTIGCSSSNWRPATSFAWNSRSPSRPITIISPRSAHNYAITW